MCNYKELARRIHDPNYMPEYKAQKRKMIEGVAAKRRQIYQSLPEEQKEKLRQEWLRVIKKTPK
jgi:shikimate kinase